MRPVFLLLVVLSLAGCTAIPGAVLPLVLSVLSIALAAGCAASHRTEGDAGPAEDAPDAPRPDGGGGSWETCCTDFGPDGHGRLSTCFCPAMTACNYGLGLLRCADGSCMYGSGGWGSGCPDDDAGPPDGGVGEDSGGTWEPCCELGDDGIGRVTSCFCPGGAECNYGLFVRCESDTCVPFGECPGDAGSPDAG